MTKKYKNLWPSFSTPSLSTLLKSASFSLERAHDTVTHPIAVQRPDFSRRPPATVWWMGHATVYLLYQNLNSTTGLLFDPIWSDRCSPSSLFGPKRAMNPPCSIAHLPKVNIVLISHDHYDHLDERTIKEIDKSHSGVIYFVPQGLKSILIRWNVSSDRICELNWWHSAIYTPDNSRIVEVPRSRERGDQGDLEVTVDEAQAPGLSTEEMTISKESEETHLGRYSVDGIPNLTRKIMTSDPELTLSNVSPSKSESPDLEVRVTCTPAQHNSGRSLLRRNQTQWCSWNVEVIGGAGMECGPLRVFFGGDTGHRSKKGGPTCPVFREIAERFGPPDLALLPIAAGSVLPYLERLLPLKLDHHALTAALHCGPRDAVEIARMMDAKRALGIHWGTFTTPAHASDTLRQLRRAREEQGVSWHWEEEGCFVTTDIGECLQL